MTEYATSIWLEACRRCGGGCRVSDEAADALLNSVWAKLPTSELGINWGMVHGCVAIDTKRLGEQRYLKDMLAQGGVADVDDVFVCGDGEAGVVLEMSPDLLHVVIDEVHGNLADHIYVVERASKPRFVLEVLPIGSAYLWCDRR